MKALVTIKVVDEEKIIPVRHDITVELEYDWSAGLTVVKGVLPSRYTRDGLEMPIRITDGRSTFDGILLWLREAQLSINYLPAYDKTEEVEKTESTSE